MSASRRAAPAALRATVGIDLGTSHTSLAFARCEPGAQVSVLPIEQWVAGRRIAEPTLLPSVAYAPLPAELPQVEGLPADWVIGEYARVRSQETAGRAIVSAKSWLCHRGVDRLGRILPWGADALDGAEKLSPVEVSRRILEQVLRAARRHQPELAGPDVGFVITVPASFDQTARQMTVMAAQQAGLAVRLLEEPQAAFYDYLDQHSGELEALVDARGPLRVLVCDIGGGTTDLSQIEVRRARGSLELRRSAVGNHLLLGGDNMDLAVARLAENALGGEPLEPARLGQLRLAARAAKEALLAADAAPSFSLRLLGGGAELLRGSRSVELGRDPVRELVLDGFFPRTPRGQGPELRRSGLTTLGLPYERDPAVTRHIAHFLERHAEGALPDALLLNGGVMRSALVRERLREVFHSWGARDVVLLSAPDPELAVCRGAVRYGLALAGSGLRIEGGAAQGYYVAIESPGEERQALCVVPRGSREGERHVLGARRFELLLGRPARFELYAHDAALHPPGARVTLDADYQPLPALTTVPEIEGLPAGSAVQVQLDGELSAVGTVELGCTRVDAASAAGEAARRFRLEFDLGAREPSARPPAAKGSAAPRARALGVDAQRWAGAEEALVRVFGKGRKDVAAREPKDLVRNLERVLGPRKEWELELCRKIADLVLDGAKNRARSEDHERAFWMLGGFCLRPGFGHPRDGERVEQLWSAFDAGLTHRDAERSWQQYWIAWRRVAGGSSEAQQGRLRDVLDPALAPAELKLKRPKSHRFDALDELLDLSSHLERLPAARRSALGGWLLDRTWSDRDPRLWTYIGRIGARVPSYASAHFALPGRTVERWVEQLLRERWSEVATAAASAYAMCRVTGDETRDVDPRLRAEVARALERAAAPEEWRRAVLEHVPVSAAEREARLGEDLPLGLRLLE
ncbi:MAG TPA: Hsp70 family protein, partial [Polyangiaceae bacterium]|nr:Hsp70 family protein [Polyangiaceae bacterium]